MMTIKQAKWRGTTGDDAN